MLNVIFSDIFPNFKMSTFKLEITSVRECIIIKHRLDRYYYMCYLLIEKI